MHEKIKSGQQYLPSLLLLAAAFVLWQLIAKTSGIDNYILPAPTEVVSSLWRDRHLLGADSLVTAEEMVLGFALALVVGFSLACLLHLWRPLRQAVYPLLIASQTVPVIVLAPILVIMFGYDIRPKLAIIALICFFPIVVNTLDGLRSVGPEQIKMMRTLDASRWSVFTRVELPTSLPFAFSGARIAATFAAIGAVFGEWVGSDAGLGHLMLQASAQLETARVFAAVVILTAFAVGLFCLVVLAERVLIPWARPNQQR